MTDRVIFLIVETSRSFFPTLGEVVSIERVTPLEVSTIFSCGWTSSKGWWFPEGVVYWGHSLSRVVSGDMSSMSIWSLSSSADVEDVDSVREALSIDWGEVLSSTYIGLLTSSTNCGNERLKYGRAICRCRFGSRCRCNLGCCFVLQKRYSLLFDMKRITNMDRS